MILHRFEVEGLAQYSYLIASNGVAAVIDPMRDIDPYLDFARTNNLTIVHVLETHIHADFASGATALVAATGATLALSAYDANQHYQYAMPHQRLQNGDTIPLGDLTIQALHTPGHTPEHLSFLLLDEASKPTHLFSGDFLFVGSLGRPDLLGEAAKYRLAKELYASVYDRIAALPDTVEVLPGHGAGSFCGGGIGSHSTSTLGHERATNPLFQLAGQLETFVNQILDSVPELPSYYPRMKAVNAAGATIFAELPGNSTLTPTDVETLSTQPHVVLLDLRSTEDFAAAHIPGSLNIGDGPSLALWAGWLLRGNSRIILISDEQDTTAARTALLRVGLDLIEGTLSGGIAAWIEAGFPTQSTPIVSPDQIGDATLIDVRNQSEWLTGHIPTARHMPLGHLPIFLMQLDKQKSYLLICAAGYRAAIAASLFQRKGVLQASILGGGMSAWQAQNLPLDFNLK